jgi:mannose-6-phosphate isomerase
VHGGFHEVIDQNGSPLAVPRRSRVQPRQVYAFAMAGLLGWNGAAREAVEQGVRFALAKHRRADGWFNGMVAPDGVPVDERANLYDQAFALFGLAAAYTVLPERAPFKAIAIEMRQRLHAELESPGQFDATHFGRPLISANAFMHLFEACLAWHDAAGDAEWLVMADEIVRFATTRFIDPRTGAVREFFDQSWNPAPGLDGHSVDPGHQYEWAWLLWRWCSRADCDNAREVAMRLFEVGESHGVDASRGVVVNLLSDDLSVHDPEARLWPQTERIKAACMAALVTGDERFWKIAVDAIFTLRRFLDTPLRGLWRDRMNVDGTFVDEPAPASSFYHIVCAVSELDRTIASSDSA